MADKKISALTGATTPLAGTEVLPIVQSGATVKVAVSDLTAGRAVATAAMTATGIVSTTDATDASSTTAASMKTAGGLGVVKKIYVGDNIVQATAAKGFNFTANTPASGMTSQLLNWYEQGTWTPGDGSGAGLTLTVSAGTCLYTRIGRQVTCSFAITYPVTVSAVSAIINGLPFNAGGSSAVFGGFVSYTDSSLNILFLQTAAQNYFNLYKNTGVGITNVEMSGKALRGTIIYFV